MKTFVLRILLALLLFAATGVQAEPLAMKQRFQIGKLYKTTTSQNMEMEMQMPGAPAPTTQVMKMRIGMELSVRAAEGMPGHKAVTFTYSEYAMEMNNPGMGMNMKYDSTDPATANSPLAAGIKPLLDVALVAIYDADDNMIELQGLDELHAKSPALKQFLNEESLKSQTDAGAQIGLDGSARQPGDKWTTQQQVAIGQMGKIDWTMNCTYVEDQVVDGLTVAIINHSGEMAMNLNLDEAETSGPAGMKLDMKINDMTGKTAFDRKLSMIRSTDISMDAIITMDMPDGNQMSIPLQQQSSYQLDTVIDLIE